jgi:hypothetical protein
MNEISEDQTSARVKQLSIFLENHIGALLAVTRVLEAQDITICALSIADAADHAVVRLVVDRPSLAAAALQADGYHLVQSDLLCITPPPGKGIGMRRVLQALLAAELNVHYIYGVITAGRHRPALALHVEDIERAATTLCEHGLQLLSQDDLR